MSWIRRAIRKEIKQVVQDAFVPGGLVTQLVHSTMDRIFHDMALENKRVSGNLTYTSFVWQMAFHMLRTDKSMDAERARDVALAALNQFLTDEHIRFGDPLFAWDQDAAENLAHELETDHWEQAA